MSEFPGKMDSWHDAADLYEMLAKTLHPHERRPHVSESPAASTVEKDSDTEWHKPETAEQRETYAEAAVGFVVEDRQRMLMNKANTKLDAELDEYYKRKYPDTHEANAASSSAGRSKRQAAEPKPMEVDEEAAEESVDYTEDVVEC